MQDSTVIIALGLRKQRHISIVSKNGFLRRKTHPDLAGQSTPLSWLLVKVWFREICLIRALYPPYVLSSEPAASVVGSLIAKFR